MSQELKEIKLTNFTIKDKVDSRGVSYYLIVDENTDDGYFCFVGKVKEGWELLSKSPSSTKLNIDYEEDDKTGKIFRRVVAIREDSSLT